MSFSNRFWFSLLACAFLLTGLLGRDVWHGPEAYVFGPIYHFYNHHTWLVPFNATLPFLEKPPLYYWTGVIFAHAFEQYLPLYDAARLATLFYMVITIVFMWKAAELLFSSLNEPRRKTLPWITVALALGSMMLVKDAHLMEPDVPLLTGASIFLYGASVWLMQPQSHLRSGFWMGAGTGVAFLAKGLFLPVLFAFSVLIMWGLRRDLQTRHTSYSFAMALLVALPFLVIWPMLLYLEFPAYFHEWFWENNVGRFLGFSVERLGNANKPFLVLIAAPRVTFPLVPLAALALWYYRREWRQPWFLLPAVISAIGLAVLTLSATARPYYLLPLTPAFAMLAALGLYCLSEKTLSVLSWITRIAAGLYLSIIWLEWWNLKQPVAIRPLPALVHALSAWIPANYVPYNSPWMPLLALAVTVFWLVALRLSTRAALDAALFWFASAAAIWIVRMALLMPWLNIAFSDYAPIAQAFETAKAHGSEADCIGYDEYLYNEVTSPVLEYIAATRFPGQRIGGKDCKFILIASSPDLHIKRFRPYETIWRNDSSWYYGGDIFWLLQKR